VFVFEPDSLQGCHVPGPERRTLTARDHRRLDRAEAKIRDAQQALIRARLAYARTVRAVGISATARDLGISRQALESRLQTIERAAREAGLD